MIFGMTLYQVLWYFLIYSIIGWIAEVIFHAVALGKIVNRGCLNGPVCPIYGFGVISIFALVYAVTKVGESALNTLSLGQLFFGGMILCSGVELLGGVILDKCFHVRWWDYSDIPFNFHGYICLEFGLIWGLASTFVLRVLHPYIRSATVEFIPEQIGFPILGVLYLIYFLDVVVTVMMFNRLNEKLGELDKVRKSLRVVSDGLTDALGTSAYVTKNTLYRGRERAEKAGKRLRENAANAGQQLTNSAQTFGRGILESLGSGREKLEAKYRELVRTFSAERYFGIGRLLRAHPGMKHRDYQEVVEELQADLDGDSAADGQEMRKE